MLECLHEHEDQFDTSVCGLDKGKWSCGSQYFLCAAIHPPLLSYVIFLDFGQYDSSCRRRLSRRSLDYFRHFCLGAPLGSLIVHKLG